MNAELNVDIAEFSWYTESSYIRLLKVHRGRIIMAVSYKKLWKLLIDRDMKKKRFMCCCGY